jgi:hypothetical protein
MGALIPDTLILDGTDVFKLLGGQLFFPNLWTLGLLRCPILSFEQKLVRPTMKLHVVAFASASNHLSLELGH